MVLKGSREARLIGGEIAEEITIGNMPAVYKTLSSILNNKNAFRLLDLIGTSLGNCPSKKLDQTLETIAHGRSMGGWVVIASAVHAHFSSNPRIALTKCRLFIKYADTWYACDCLGERIPGPFLISDFRETIALMSGWRYDSNRWVRRAVGVAVHFWAKRTRGADTSQEKAKTLLAFLKPMLDEKEYQAAKGIGWGLKTLGRYYPDLAFDWLNEVLIVEKHEPLAVIRRKALTYLPAEMKQSLSRLI